MPAGSGIYSVDQVGKIPEIEGKFTLLEMAKTPFTSMLRKGPKPGNIQVLYHARNLRAVPRTGRLEGADVASYAARVRKEVYARGQFFGGDTTSFKVSDQAEINKLADGVDEFSLQKAEALLELKRQMESQFLSNDDSTAEAGATPNTTRGAFSWGSASAQTHLPVDSDLRPVAAQSLSGTLNTTNWNETKFLTAMRTCFDQRNEEVDLVGLCGSVFMETFYTWVAYKPNVSNYTPVLAVNVSGERSGPAIFPVVDVLTCQHGTVKLKPSAELLKDSTGARTTSSKTSAVFLDPDLWELAYYKPVHSKEFPDLGGGRRGAHFSAAILKCLHPQGQVYLNFQE